MKIKRALMIVAGKTRDWSKGTAAVKPGGLIFLSGSVGFDKNGDIAKSVGEETRLALESIKQSVEEYGSSLENLVHIYEFVVGEFPNGIGNDPKWVEIDNEMQEYWKEHCPQFLRSNNPVAETTIECNRTINGTTSRNTSYSRDSLI